MIWVLGDVEDDDSHLKFATANEGEGIWRNMMVWVSYISSSAFLFPSFSQLLTSSTTGAASLQRHSSVLYRVAIFHYVVSISREIEVSVATNPLFL